jgi:hypothetical protein
VNGAHWRVTRNVRLFGGFPFRPVIKAYVKEFRLDVLAYDRRSLINQDIISDFVQRYLPPAGSAFSIAEIKEVITSFPAKVMAIMLHFRSKIYLDKDN